MMQLPGPEMIEDLALTRLQPDRPAHAAIVSLPAPPGAGDVRAADFTSQAQPIAWWREHLAGEAAGQPRRVLLTVAGEADLPPEIRVTRDAVSEAESGAGPQWETRVLEHNYVGTINWETGELGAAPRRRGDRPAPRAARVRTASRCGGSGCGSRNSGRARPAARSASAGYVSAMRLHAEHPDVVNHRPCKWTHRQHWLFCEVYALLFANGVVHLTARHVNNRSTTRGATCPACR
jgi:hypothetical protein